MQLKEFLSKYNPVFNKTQNQDKKFIFKPHCFKIYLICVGGKHLVKSNQEEIYLSFANTLPTVLITVRGFGLQKSQNKLLGLFNLSWEGYYCKTSLRQVLSNMRPNVIVWILESIGDSCTSLSFPWYQWYTNTKQNTKYCLYTNYIMSNSLVYLL